MDRQRYVWFQIARAFAGEIPETGLAEREVLDDAAEAFLLARSHDQDLEEAIENASWALTHLIATGVLLENEARGLWEAICACGPSGVDAAGFSRGELAPADDEIAGRLRRIFQGRSH